MAHDPQLHAVIAEYCRRLQLFPPRVGVIETPALNIASFGFSRKKTYLVVTRGVLDTLSRQEIAALLGRELCYLWYGEVYCQSWLSQFLATLDRILAPAKWRQASHQRRTYPFKLFLRQMFLYPLTLLPAYFLRSAKEPLDLDLRSVRVTRKPKALAEGLRALEALQERVPYQVPFSLRHLYLLPPPTGDPLARIFFASEDFAARIDAVERLSRVVMQEPLPA